MKVKLKVRNDDKVGSIKFIRTLTGLGLKESKDLFESVLPWKTESDRQIEADLVLKTKLSWAEVLRAADAEGYLAMRSRVTPIYSESRFTIEELNESCIKLTVNSDNLMGTLEINRDYPDIDVIIKAFMGCIRVQ